MLNIFAPINILGYGIHSTNLIKALVEKGQELTLSQIGEMQLDPFFEMYYKEAIKNNEKFSSKDPSLFIFHDELSHQSCGNPLFVYSIFETTLLKPSSRNMLDNGPADIILTTTEAHKKLLLEQGITKPIEVVNEGIDETLYNTIPVNKYIDTKKLTYITLGKREERKNTDAIIRVFINLMKDKEVALICHTFNPFINRTQEHPFKNLTCWSGVNPLKHGFEYKGFDGKAHKFTLNKCDIYFTVPTIQVSNMPSLLHSANIGIQVSRGEGWDLPCFTAGTKISTMFGWKNIEDITINDFVLTDKGRFKQVKTVFKNNISDKKLYELKVNGNNIPINVTEEHPILGIKRKNVKKTRTGFQFNNNQVEFIKVKDLKPGDFLVKRKYKEMDDIVSIDLAVLDPNLEKSTNKVWYKTGFNNKGEQIKINRYPKIKECSFILGLFLAEGSFDGNKVTISLHSKESDLAQHFIEDIEKIFGYKTNWSKKYGNKYYIEFGSKIIGKFFEYLCGNGSHNKELKRLGYNKISKDIINAAFLGDGHTTKSNWKIYTTVSENFALQYFEILQNQGFTPIIQKKFRKDKGTIEFVISWLENKNRRHSRKMWFKEDIGTITTITSIKQIDFSDLVYNLEVEDDNTYQLPSFTAHNCSEMLACGIPTIATDCIGHKEYLTDNIPTIQKDLLINKQSENLAIDGVWFKGNQGSWDNLNVEKFTEVLENTFNNASTYEEKSEQLADYMSSNFSWGKAAETLLSIIEKYKG